MAKFEFKLPDIGEGVTEGEVVTWYVKEGDRVSEDQVMVEVMTDKATVTIGAPRDGKIEQLMAEPGTVVQVGDVLVVIHTGNGSRAHGQQPAATAVGDIKESLPGTSYFGEKRASVVEAPDRAAGKASAPDRAAGKASAPDRAAGQAAAPAQATVSTHYDERPLATPATRKLARDLHVDLKRVPGTGPGGRVTKDDVKLHSSSGTISAPTASTGGAGAEASMPAERRVPAGLPAAPLTARRAPTLGAGQRVPFVGMRRRIAENMTLSKNTAAHFTFVEECDVGRLMQLRSDLREDARERGVELTYLPFVIKAVVGALRKHPVLNSSLDTESNELVLHAHCHIGIAAATDSGLVVPVIHHAESMSLLELATEIERLGNAARDGQLTVQDMQGSTFTVTSLGKQAGLFAVPIINFPNVGILGIHRMKERPVVRDGEIVIGQVMLLSLSLDHRIVDGHQGAAFAYDVIRYLEEPARLLLD